MFKKLENVRPFLKMAFEGFAGDGKTFTATQIAIGLHQQIGSKNPIAIFDTERAASKVKHLYDAAGIEALVVDDQRSLASLSTAISQCESGLADILIIDSITHVWEEYLAAYLKSKNRSRLQFEDWGIIKPKWKNEFSNKFVSAKCHIIFTGRAGYEYTDERDEETGKRQIFKSGIKMKAENETAFEPDILVLMEKKMNLLGEKKTVTRDATIIKDRTNTIDGQTFTNPGYNEFAPAINRLLDGIVKASNTQEIQDNFDDAEAKFAKTKREREALISEIEGVFNLMGLGTSVKDKQFKAATLKKIWNVVSIDLLVKIKVEDLSSGIESMKTFADTYAEYLQYCADNQENPDNSHIGSLLDKAIEVPI